MTTEDLIKANKIAERKAKLNEAKLELERYQDHFGDNETYNEDCAIFYDRGSTPYRISFCLKLEEINELVDNRISEINEEIHYLDKELNEM